MIDISFKSDWLRRWREYFWTNRKAKYSNTKESINYFRQSIENYSSSSSDFLRGRREISKLNPGNNKVKPKQCRVTFASRIV